LKKKKSVFLVIVANHNRDSLKNVRICQSVAADQFQGEGLDCLVLGVMYQRYDYSRGSLTKPEIDGCYIGGE
jgi:hypothetical protein